MKKLFLFLFFGAFAISVFSQKGKNVLYGEYAENNLERKNTYRLFYDKEGNLYPDFEIKEAELIADDASLKSYFETNQVEFQEAAKVYSLNFEGFSKANFQEFQNNILADKLLTINKLSQKFSNLTLLIHGFRKHFKATGGDSSSKGDNQEFQNAIAHFGKKDSKHFFVEIYWDGTYVSRSRKIKDIKPMLRLFEDYAIQNAIHTGYKMRSLVSKIQHPKISVIGHSLGAQVAINCFFNANKNSVEKSYYNLPTPNQDINICLIAPAISGKVFDHFLDRNRAIATKDNYHFFVLYNEKDVVLKKRWKGIGPGPRKFGRTTLGCNHRRELFKLEKKFKKDYPKSVFQISDATKYGLCHSVGCYAWYKNFRELVAFID